MKKIFLVILFAFFAAPAMGQSTQTFVHDFGDYKVYQTLGNFEDVSWITTAKIKDRSCERVHVSPVEVSGDSIIFEQGKTDTVWRTQYTEDGGVVFKFPNGENVKYETADLNPRKYCGEGREI